jgi:hypothetical protein
VSFKHLPNTDLSTIGSESGEQEGGQPTDYMEEMRLSKEKAANDATDRKTKAISGAKICIDKTIGEIEGIK